MPEPITREEFIEAGAPSNYLFGAWLGLFSTLWNEPDCHKAFCEQTGAMPLALGGSPIERMVDEATGRDREYMLKFAKWVTEFHWGEIE